MSLYKQQRELLPKLCSVDGFISDISPLEEATRSVPLP